jgi:hypothetical protein
MNAKGLPVMLQGVLATLEMASIYQKLVTDRKISQDELDGTRHNLKATIATLKHTPEKKIEALVARHDAHLTETLHKFQALDAGHLIEKFRLAQIMQGFAATIMAKAGI